MKRISGFILIAVLFGVSYAWPVLAKNADEEEVQTPFIVIRFDHPDIDYSKPLYKAISRAIEVKPDAEFDIVSVAPRAPTVRKQRDFDHTASENTRKVLATLHDIGLPGDRINPSNAVDDVSASEVRIYVH